ncbi:MAG: hypothetical protein KC431_25655, partial [Myxococcales bacterium]|nr:hypothetical protein [Myxococcales bacterium]
MQVRTATLGMSLVALTLAACHAPQSTSTLPGEAVAENAALEIDPGQDLQRELEVRYRLALTTFDRGDHDDAAAQFAALLLRVPQTPEGDSLRHLLIQQIAWSLLASYDHGGDPGRLDAGEAMLERYLEKHEALRPMDMGDRAVIYALLGEFSLRREGAIEQPISPTGDAMAGLVRATAHSLDMPQARSRRGNEDRMVREI